MNTLSDETLLSLNQQGIIPGPHETEAQFQQRADYCLKLRSEPPPPFSKHMESEDTQNILDEAFPKTRKLFDIAPQWIPVFFNNHQLAPWHGGCAWIFQISEDTPTAALLQLRQNLLKKTSYLGLYKREELVSHELCHVGRMMFEEPNFEELIAYRTSNSSFRKIFGPIVKSSFESMFFVLVLFLIFLVDLFLMMLGQERALMATMWLKIISLGMIGFGLLRLYRRHQQLNRCLQKLRILTKNDLAANAILYRLTDREIIDFGSMSEEAIKKYALEEPSFRWKVIRSAYTLAFV